MVGVTASARAKRPNTPCARAAAASRNLRSGHCPSSNRAEDGLSMPSTCSRVIILVHTISHRMRSTTTCQPRVQYSEAGDSWMRSSTRSPKLEKSSSRLAKYLLCICIMNRSRY